MDASDIAEALRLARYWHGDQVDKAGQPYVDAHVLDVHRRVADQPPAVQVVALLHDVLEDTACPEADLRQRFPDEVVAAVVAISRIPGEDPSAYYARVRADRLALPVKLADIASNTDPERNALLDAPTRERLAAKYRRALAELTG